MLGSAVKDADFSILFFAKQKHMRLACFTIKCPVLKKGCELICLLLIIIESLMNIKAECIKNAYETVA